MTSDTKVKCQMTEQVDVVRTGMLSSIGVIYDPVVVRRPRSSGAWCREPGRC